MSTEHLHEDGPSKVLLTVHNGRPDGLRTVSTLESIFQVGAAPWAERRQLMSATAHWRQYRGYVLDIDRSYVGHGADHREFGQHLKKPVRDRTQQVFLIGSQDERLNKELASILEAKLIEAAVRLGVPLYNDNLPHGISSNAPAIPDKWVRQIMFLLGVVGYTGFSRAEATSTVPRLLPVNTRADDVRIVEPADLVVPPGATPLMLNCRRDLRVEAYRVENRLLVMPGSDYGRTCKSSVSNYNRKRREQIEAADILEPCPVLPDRMLLRYGLDFKHAALAATVISGEHLRTNAWQPKLAEKMRQAKAPKNETRKNKASKNESPQRPRRRTGR